MYRAIIVFEDAFGFNREISNNFDGWNTYRQHLSGAIANNSHIYVTYEPKTAPEPEKRSKNSQKRSTSGKNTIII